jgi:RimJ/RimL family protein N-acetyltransferase
VAWLNDPEVLAGLLAFAPLSLAEEEKWYEAQLKNTRTHLFAIDVDVDGTWTHVGNTALENVSHRNQRASVGIFIGDKSRWGQGIAQRALELLMVFGFAELNLHRIELEVFEDNAAAIRCYEKLGFEREGLRREAIFKGGAFRNLVLMALLNADHSQKPNISGAK